MKSARTYRRMGFEGSQPLGESLILPFVAMAGLFAMSTVGLAIAAA